MQNKKNEKKETIDIELIVAVTGESYQIEGVPLSMTPKDLLEEFCKNQNVNPKMGMAWKLLFGSSMIDDKLKFSEIIKNSEELKFTLIAKVEGA